MDERLLRQNEVLIGLLARSALGANKIHEIVTKNKRDPRAYVKVYNLLRGNLGVVEAAKIAGVSPGTMSGTLSYWESQGIIYDTGDGGRPAYMRLLCLPEKAPSAD